MVRARKQPKNGNAQKPVVVNKERYERPPSTNNVGSVWCRPFRSRRYYLRMDVCRPTTHRSPPAEVRQCHPARRVAVQYQ